MSRFQLFIVVVAMAGLFPSRGRGQVIFDWPLRATAQPEAVIRGAGAVLWNPGSLVGEVGTSQEAWVIHVDGPDVTGVRGMAFSGVMDLPMELRAGLAYSHLGIRDIPRTTTSPQPEPGDINVGEDAVVLALAKGLSGNTGLGGGIRFVRGAVGRESRTQVEGEVGIHHQTALPLSPRVGVALRGVGRDLETLGGFELSLPPLSSSRIPIRVGYGIQTGDGGHPADHRFSLRGSWKDQFHLGMGFSYLGEDDGWTSLWTLGADVGRYSLAVLRESLPNGFGSAHFFQASIRFP